MDIAHFGNNLARCRKRADLSQDELAIRASPHRTEVSQVELGLRIRRIDTLVKLAASLEVPAEDLLTGLSWTPAAIGLADSGRSKRTDGQPAHLLGWDRGLP
jgi:transcriptional regulator with XRE-family HTH domain